ncbi:helix-turn-helix transcriptional regulator [uncultured Succiniclasticum sp.]|uniref:helix-turn-helix domain-containing protein n=1 Tax=uncultured Succiniclasticum sp. TaxID=1500547 RepID=UPI0025D64B63|nr:helix-turn-helix transcriptional regulator [uncultured Succiniclasticum sp.]
MSFDFVSIGKRLKEARLKQNLKQQQLADLLGISVSYVKNVERGKKPSLSYLKSVVEHCHVSYDWLLTGCKTPYSDQKDPFAYDFPIDRALVASEDSVDDDRIKILKMINQLLTDSDPDIRSWAKIQIKRAFPEYFKDENI